MPGAAHILLQDVTCKSSERGHSLEDAEMLMALAIGKRAWLHIVQVAIELKTAQADSILAANGICIEASQQDPEHSAGDCGSMTEHRPRSVLAASVDGEIVLMLPQVNPVWVIGILTALCLHIPCGNETTS